MEPMTCFICGRNFSVVIICRHEDVCFSHWRKRNFQLPSVHQKALPEKPKGVNFSSRESDSQYNNAAKASSLKCRLPQFVRSPSVRSSVEGSADVKQIQYNTSEHTYVNHMTGDWSKVFPRIYSSKTRLTSSPVVLSKSSSRDKNVLNSFGVYYRAQGWTSDLIRDPCTYVRVLEEFPAAIRDETNPDRFMNIPILDKRKFPVDKTLLEYDQNYDIYARIHFPWERTNCVQKF